ncbi:hypothetical protein [Rhodococcus sp. IEGM 1379]|uniref:hypothetical protein n=1 Tax=Rhodococcus sp. IEGM 1379 TaxID=3047086 RepID=UPI0024B74AE6|nr:hypothetical protein [Rhodococcus sp. IEGM 1379]MDI9916315.1 hypothetical protein [Rhodococcus sp. IEGM 1379]
MQNPGGEFGLDPDVARPIVKACEILIGEYQLLANDARHLNQFDGFGTLASGPALQKKFQDKAFGGTDSLVNALESHIAAVDGMRAYFQKCIDDAVAQEQANADSLRNAGPPT